MADPIDIDATVVSLLRSYGPNERDINVICNEVDRLRADNEALVAAVRWAQDAPHYATCGARYNAHLKVAEPRSKPYPCTCGRDEALKPFGGDR